MRFAKLILAVLLIGGAAGALEAMEAAKKPDAGDPWTWLTDINGARALAWVKAQNAKSLPALQSDPNYARDYDAILSVLNAQDRIAEPRLDRQYVFNFWQDANHVRGIWRRTTIADYAKPDPKWETVLDLDALDASEHKNWVWQGADCTPAFDRCLVRLSPGGGDADEIREYDVNTRQFVSGGFTLPVAKSSASYVDDDTILFATDFGPGSATTSSYPRIVKLWHRGEPLQAAKTVFEGQTSDVLADPAVFSGPYGTIPLVIRSVTFFTAEYYYVLPDGSTMKLPLPPSAIVRGVTGGNIIFTLRDDWTPPGGSQAFKQGSLVAFPVMAFVKTKMLPSYALLLAPGPRSTIDTVATGRDAVFASVFENVTGAIHAFRAGADGTWSDTTLALPSGGSTEAVSANPWGPEAYFTYESFLKPETLYAYDGQSAPAEIKSEPARFDASNLVADQFWVASKDGTQVPYFLIHAKDQHGPVPTILYSYGGFELSLVPWYWNDGHRPLDAGQTWLAKGGAIAVANIRGGGEFGPAWHEAALQYHRQRAFDDFEAVAADIEHRGFSTPRQLGIVGASNGGLLVSTVMVQRPDLFGAVVCQRPLIDMLTYTHFGAGASWIGEYGDPADPRMAAYIKTYSPYRNVKADVQYPPVLFITETSDDRVTPVFARKMAAKMEAQGHDVLFYESMEGGHGPGATNAEEATYWALSYTYFAQKLGLR